MNIFYLDKDPMTCAQMHNDKHCVKMILEYAQLLSTAHRVIDGVLTIGRSEAGRKQTRYVLPGSRESTLYLSTHVNHPSAVWVRQSVHNYNWLYDMWVHLMAEYTYRYGKIHATARLIDVLRAAPQNIPVGVFTEPTPAMPDDVKIPGNSIASYQKYYINNKAHLANWKKRPIPSWFLTI